MPKIIPLNYRKLAKVFEKNGWILIHQKGSHLVYKKPGFKRRIVIPAYREVPIFVIKNNLRTAQIPRERYFELLNQM